MDELLEVVGGILFFIAIVLLFLLCMPFGVLWGAGISTKNYYVSLRENVKPIK